MGAKTYVKQVVNNAFLFWIPSKEWTSPIDKDDHPELDIEELSR
jgi:hypothetical protein